jgi:hypothetical protein
MASWLLHFLHRRLELLKPKVRLGDTPQQFEGLLDGAGLAGCFLFGWLSVSIDRNSFLMANNSLTCWLVFSRTLASGDPVSIHKRHLSAHAGVLALRNPRRRRTTPAVAKSLRPWPEPKSTISGWTPAKEARE